MKSLLIIWALMEGRPSVYYESLRTMDECQATAKEFPQATGSVCWQASKPAVEAMMSIINAAECHRKMDMERVYICKRLPTREEFAAYE